MAIPPRAERTIASGSHGTVEYAVRADGSMEAKEWLEAQPDAVKRSFGVLFERLVTQGRISNKTQFRQLKDEVWEFKRGGNRIYCFQLGNRRLLTHRIKKPGGSGKARKSDIAHADLVGQEHIELETKRGKK